MEAQNEVEVPSFFFLFHLMFGRKLLFPLQGAFRLLEKKEDVAMISLWCECSASGRGALKVAIFLWMLMVWVSAVGSCWEKEWRMRLQCFFFREGVMARAWIRDE